MKRYLLSALFFTLVCAGCRHEQHHATATHSTAAATETQNETAAPYDLRFLDTMAKHHQMAVEMVRMGKDRFTQPELKRVAGKMEADQQKEIAQMKQWRDQWYPGAAPAEDMSMPGMQSSMMDMSHMTSMSGKQLDLMFVQMMIPHHEGAIVMSRDALAKTQHQEVKALAQSIIDSQSKEIEQMRQWQTEWSK